MDIENTPSEKILVVGELLADIISERDVATLASPTSFQINQGGSSSNLSANLKWLGVDTHLIATVGNDNLGTLLIDELKKVGLSDEHIARSACRQTSIVLVGKNPHTPDFIAYRSADIAIKRVDTALIESCSIIHSTAFALSKEPARTNIINALIKAHQLGKTISIDWNFAPSIWQEDDGKDVFRKICKLYPLLKMSIDDLERFANESMDHTQAKEWLDQLNVKAICLTCGKDGVWFKQHGQQWVHKPALQVKEVAGVTGAGDAFWSGFLAHYLKRESIDNCVAHALEIAKLKIELPYPLYKN
ncbi:carbohydrate kinase family protein [Pedobacter sandarakinus]|uniref:carbohydrate kinase family protein n=1 Tax=Pedobacter sandarakinus TaxID=353156 RepID=UPI0022459AFF|nr:carbohydrate kinase family protein [Pedobacter sandarakinus]MCX2575110.1 carbohydrate kinase family protein [Pedobacter sandarakinus]